MNPRFRRALRSAVEELAPPSLLVLRGPASERRVALSFDDGPDAMTGEYLDALDRFGARATFFLLGSAIERHPEALHEIVRRGHEVASHSYSHRRFPTLSAAAMGEELARTAALLPPARRTPPLFRPPQGNVSARSLLRTAAAGYTTMLWSLDSDDCRTEDPEQVMARVAPGRVAPGEIILLHEGQRWTLEALPRILERLVRAGYRFDTASELLGRF